MKNINKDGLTPKPTPLTENSPETAPEIRVVSSPQTSDPPPTAQEQQQVRINTTMTTPENAEPLAPTTPLETNPNQSPAAATPAAQSSAIPEEQEPANAAVKVLPKPEDLAMSRVLGTLDVLTDVEQADLPACEEVVGSGCNSFVQPGLALARIRDLRLYRTEFDSFEAPTAKPNGSMAGATLIN
jgi:hypothetical protein